MCDDGNLFFLCGKAQWETDVTSFGKNEVRVLFFENFFCTLHSRYKFEWKKE